METENSGVGGGLRAVRGLRVDARAVSRGFEAPFWSLFASSVSLHLGSSSVSRFLFPASRFCSRWGSPWFLVYSNKKEVLQ